MASHTHRPRAEEWRARDRHELRRGVLSLLASAMIGAAPAGASPIAFERTEYPIASAPLWLASEDFDRDGHRDLVVTVFSNQLVAFFRGNGAGGFTRLGDIPVGEGPWGIAAGDLNGDENPDLMVADTGSDRISILFGNGGGGFAPGTPVPAHRYPRAVLVADFDADTNADLAVSNLLADDVTIHLGNGAGGFTAGVVLAGGDGPGLGGTGDFNSDGHADLAVGNQNSDDVTVWLGLGNGAFSPPASLPAVRHPHGAVVGRVDLDPHDDVVADNVYSRPPVVSVMLGNGDGTFAPAINAASGDTAPSHAAIADLDLDGLPDLAVTLRDAIPPAVAVLAGDGAGGFAPPELIAVALRPQCVLADDFDEDGKTDLAVTGFDANRLTILLNRTPAPAAIPTAIAVSPVQLAPVAPNPFTGATVLRFVLALPGRTRLGIVDAKGRAVRLLLDRELAFGPHAVTWDGRDEAGRPVAAGAYYFRIVSGSATGVRPVIVLP